MELDQVTREQILKYKSRIEIIQWAFTSAIASIIYCEYLKNIRQQHKPTFRVLVPQVRRVQEILLIDGPLIEWVATGLIPKMMEDELMISHITAPELEPFTPEHIDELKNVLCQYMIPNIVRTIPDIIARKFSIGVESNQTFFEDSDIDLFDRDPAQSWITDYIAHEAVLQLLLLLPSLDSRRVHPESNVNLYLDCNDVLTVNCESAICPIHLDYPIISMEPVMDLFQFVLNTVISRWDTSAGGYVITSGVFNQLTITSIGNAP